MIIYNRLAEIPELGTAVVNLYFLQSLGRDWGVWGMTKGDSTHMKLTAELMAEVHALAMRGASGQLSESSTSLSESQELKVQVSRFNGNGRQDYDDSSGNSGKWKRNGKEQTCAITE